MDFIFSLITSFAKQEKVSVVPDSNWASVETTAETLLE